MLVLFSHVYLSLFECVYILLLKFYTHNTPYYVTSCEFHHVMSFCAMLSQMLLCHVMFHYTILTILMTCTCEKSDQKYKNIQIYTNVLSPAPSPPYPPTRPPPPDPGYIPPRCLSCHNMLQKPIPTIDASRLPGFPPFGPGISRTGLLRLRSVGKGGFGSGLGSLDWILPPLSNSWIIFVMYGISVTFAQNIHKVDV